MKLEDILVLILSVIMVATSVVAVSSIRLMRAALAFGISLFAIGLVYMSLGQTFLGFIQIFLYVGGVAVLVVFAFLTAFSTEEVEYEKSITESAGIVLGLLTTLLLAIIFLKLSEEIKAPAVEVTAQEIGRLLMTRYLFQFEAISILLLASIVAALTFVLKGRK